MKLTKNDRLTDGFKWRCRVQSKFDSHEVTRNSTKGTWFEESKMSLCKVLKATRQELMMNEKVGLGGE